jgi:hypothetical protein
MSLFKLERHKVVLDMDVVANVPQYVALYEADKSDGKELAIAKFRLIFHMVDRRSPYATSDSRTRLTKIIQDLFPMLVEWEKQGQTGKGMDKQYLAALHYYTSCLDLVPEYALLTAAQDAVHDLARRISEPKIKKGAKGAEVEVDDDKTGLLSKMRKASEDLAAIKAIVKEAEAQAEAVKGGHSLKMREDPKYLTDRRS